MVRKEVLGTRASSDVAGDGLLTGRIRSCLMVYEMDAFSAFGDRRAYFCIDWIGVLEHLRLGQDEVKQF